MANLYEIDQLILDCIDEETGEILDIEKLNQLNMERDKKIEYLALLYKNSVADTAMYKTEKDVFSQKEKIAKNKSDSLKKYLDNILGKSSFKTSKVDIKYRKSTSVEVTDIYKIDDSYLEYSEPKPKKIEIKKALELGIEIRGAILIEEQNIQIK